MNRTPLAKLLGQTEFGLFLAIVAVVLTTTLLDERHNYVNNFEVSAKDILRQTSMLGIFTLGAAIVIIAGGIDLSCGSVIAFSGTVCASLMLMMAPEEMKNSTPVGRGVIIAAIAGTLLLGILIGSLHAWLITVIGLPPFVATLATLVGLRSLGRAMIERVTKGDGVSSSTQIAVNDPTLRYLTRSEWIPICLFIVLAAITWLLMSRTVVGRHLHALGGNEQATRLSGIHTDRLKWLAYCISALLSSIAGILYISDQSVAEPQTLGRGYELNAIAAAVVGGCSLQGGVGTIPGTVLGVLFLRLVMDGVNKIIQGNADTYEGLIVGILVVTAVAFNKLREARRHGKRFLDGPLGLVTIVNLGLLVGGLAAIASKKNPLVVGGTTVVATLVVLQVLRNLESRGGMKVEQEGNGS